MPPSTSQPAEPLRRRPTALYRLARAKVWVLCRLLFRLRVEGAEHVPPSGPVLVLCNHRSILDPVVLAVALPRRALYVGAAELAQIPVLRTVMRWYGVIAVRRGEFDRAVIRDAAASLAAGQVVALFPEGGVTTGPDLRPFRLGAGLVAAVAGSPIVPVALLGTDHAIPVGRYVPRLRPVTVRIGAPLPPPRSDARADVEAAMQAAQDAILQLLT